MSMHEPPPPSREPPEKDGLWLLAVVIALALLATVIVAVP